MARLDPTPADRDRHAPARALIDSQLVMLTRLAEIGMEIAEAAGQAAVAGAAPLHDPGLTYSRAARAVRLTIALQSRLLADLAALDRAEALVLATRATARNGRVHDIVERAIEAEHDGDEDEIERLLSEASERLTDLDDADLANRPLGEIVALICKDLGLSPERTAWALEACGPAASAAVPAPPDINRPGPPAPDPAVAASTRPAAKSRAPPAPAMVA